MALSPIDCGKTSDKAPLRVGVNLQKTEFMANERAKIIHCCLKCCIPERDFKFTPSAIGLYLFLPEALRRLSRNSAGIL
jgi:hypothetical protein